MKTARDIQALFRDAGIGTHPAADRAVLDDALQAGGLTLRKYPARDRPRIWRVLMESRITKLTIAALIVMAAMLGVRSFNGTPVKAVEFSEIARAMSEVPWMHASTSGFERGIAGVAQQWIGFQSKVHAGCWADGKASFWNMTEHRRAEYDPNTETITLTRDDGECPLNLASPALMLESMHKMLKEQGAEVVAKMSEHQGRRVQVQEITLHIESPDGTQTQKLILYVDTDSKLLHVAEVSGADADGKVVMAGEIAFDYPKSGPRDIYDLGVPRDAEVIDKTPLKEFQRVLGEYNRVRAEAGREYLVVVTHVEHDNIISMVDVDCRSGRKYRMERHFVFHRGEVLNEFWPRYREQLGDSFESLLTWTRGHHDDPRANLSIYLYDGEYYGSTSRDEEGGWAKREKRYEPAGDLGPLMSLRHLAWPDIVSTARIIDDDYAREKGLICIESLSQGRVFPDGQPSLPGRFLYYLDPSWNHLCRRQVTEWRPDADWQEDRNWLAGVDPNRMRDGSITVQEITEAFQAPNGHWYPVVIIEQSTGIRKDYRQAPLRTGTTKRVYLNLAPEFPDGIFDIDKLPGQ